MKTKKTNRSNHKREFAQIVFKTKTRRDSIKNKYAKSYKEQEVAQSYDHPRP